MLSIYQIAAKTLKSGGIIAYPTEGVYGLGCDPYNKKAVLKIFALKKRDVKKGLILIASSWEQIDKLIAQEKVPVKILAKLKSSWPRNKTLILPAAAKVPEWITGEHKTVALRITRHKVAKAICEAFAGAIVSTSANIAHKKPARTYKEVMLQFGENAIDFIVAGEIGRCKKSTQILDVLTGTVYRI
jgi:L-threonylcarbamoyladenylate synthase